MMIAALPAMAAQSLPRIAAALAIAALASMPALADGGVGAGVAGCAGGVGGTGFTGNPGGNGGNPCNPLEAAGGGGGGAGGGNGGNGGNGVGGASTGAGGAGGTAANHDGQNGGDGSGSGGGGGGGYNGNGAGTASITNASPLIGGNGGNGGNGGSGGNGGFGGGGGAGGYGAVVTGAGLSTNTSSITGGNGGFAGISFANGGGDGGLGVIFTAANVTFNNSGIISGGAGGGMTEAFSSGTAGNGGAGVAFTAGGATFNNTGTIIAGNGGSGGNNFFTGGVGGTGVQFTANASQFTNSGTVTGGNGAQGVDFAAAAGGVGVAFASGGTLTNSGAITGGNGGGSFISLSGAGAAGVVFGAGGTTFTNSGTVTGGNGGLGGFAPGGIGGVAVAFSAAGATFNNSGTVQGGNGATGVFGESGAGGAGITGGNLTIVNSANIVGGLAGDGTTRANAITFTGGTNLLELLPGSNVVGNVAAFSAADTLRLSGTGNGSFDASQINSQYLGFGNFVKDGSSTWTLTGINGSAVSWSINAGVLNVSGVMGNFAMSVNSGGTLTGSGIVGATQVNAGATFAPGNGTPGTSTTINGSLALQSGAMYVVTLNPATASFANVTGTATLGGATVNATFANGSYISKQYTILTAGSVSGSFGTLVNTNLPQNFSSDALSYDATHAYLNLALNFVPPSAPSFGTGLSGNQQAVGNALINFFNTTGGIPMVYGTLTTAGLTQASGELGTGSQQTTFDAMNQFMGMLTDPFVNRTGGAGSSPGVTGYAEEGDASTYVSTKKTDAFAMFTKAPPAPFVPRWSVWAAGFGGSQSTDGNAAAGSNNTTSSVYGTAVGADYLFSPNTVAGFALAGGGTNFSVVNSGSGHSDLFQAGAYVRHTEGAAYISAALAYGWQDITTNRTVTAAGFDQLRAEFNANAYSGRVEGGYRFVAPWTGGVGITPYAAGQFTTFDLPSYAESVLSGSGAFALAYGAKDVTDSRSELGFRTDKSWAMPNGVLTLRSRFAWAYDFDPDRSIGATFQALPGASFVVNGAAQAHDSALTTASLEMKWMNGWSAAATFEGEFSDVTSSYAGKGVVRYRW